jgi:hypothetical protein
MVTHIVMFSWVDGVTDAQAAAFADALEAMASELSHLVTMRHGRDLGYREINADYALVATFANKADWDAYQAHPAHLAFIRDIVTPIQASRRAVQF